MKHSFLVVLFGLFAAATPKTAQEVGSSTETKAEAYYYFCLARWDEMDCERRRRRCSSSEKNVRVEAAIENYQRAAELDPEAGYPHAALAELYDRLQQTEIERFKVRSGLSISIRTSPRHIVFSDEPTMRCFEAARREKSNSSPWTRSKRRFASIPAMWRAAAVSPAC